MKIKKSWKKFVLYWDKEQTRLREEWFISKNGKGNLVGPYRTFHHNGMPHMTCYYNENGDPVGSSIKMTSTGCLYERMTFSNDGSRKTIGLYELFYDHNKPFIRFTYTNDGKLTGEGKRWSATGELTEFIVYNNGKEVKRHICK